MKKQCSRCKEYKNLTEFHLDKEGLYGVKSICKECRKKKIKQPKNSLKYFYDSMMRGIIRSIKKNKEMYCFKFLDYTLEEMKEHISKKLSEDMTWENFGFVWGLDFIIPKKYYKDIKEYKKCFDLRNIRPLHLKSIRRKQGRIFMEEIEENNLLDLLPIGGIIYEH